MVGITMGHMTVNTMTVDTVIGSVHGAELTTIPVIPGIIQPTAIRAIITTPIGTTTTGTINTRPTIAITTGRTHTRLTITILGIILTTGTGKLGTKGGSDTDSHQSFLISKTATSILFS